MNLTSLSNVKDFLNITDANSDTILNGYLETISKYIEHFCNRVFDSATYTEYHSGDRSYRVFVKNPPIVCITSVHDDTGREYGITSLIDPTQYTFDSVAGIIKFDLQLSRWENNIKVVYVGGYSSLPVDLELAARLLVSAKWLEQQTTSNLVEKQGESRSEKYQKQAEEILNLYRRLPYGIKL